MELLATATNSLIQLFNPIQLGMLFVGVAVGLIIGILPGLAGVVGMALMLPFVWDMEPNTAVTLLIGMLSVLRTVDTIPAVLFAVPGTAGSQATVIDGFPMAKKGEAARALGAAFTASMIGGLFGAAFLILSFPIAQPLISALGSPEFFMLSILGISMVGVLSGNRPIKGVVAGLLGMALSSIGGQPSGYGFRYTFNLLYLNDGFPLVVIALGLFAIPEITDLVIKGTTISDNPKLGKGMLQGVKDCYENLFLILRCSLLGTYIGFLPGLGYSPANWLAYGHTVQSSKDKENFGKGDVRGVIGPEAANNAAAGGSLIPTLLFGIPGSGTMAVFLFALMILGVDPGPNLLTNHLDLACTMVWALAIGNVISTSACFLITKPIAKITTIKIHYWVPFVLMMIILGAFQSTSSWGDLISLLVIGIMGWLLKEFEWPRPPILMGFILGEIAEKYLWISVQRYDASWLTRPLVIFIGVLTVASILMGISWKRKRRSDHEI
ncbi:tripartite tricarboxylate transporter permease [Thermodesulfobacteriota bacterium]